MPLHDDAYGLLYKINVDTCMGMSCACMRAVCVCMCLFGVWSMTQEAQALLPLLLQRGDHHPARDELHKACACIVQRLCILSVIAIYTIAICILTIHIQHSCDNEGSLSELRVPLLSGYNKLYLEESDVVYSASTSDLQSYYFLSKPVHALNKCE